MPYKAKIQKVTVGNKNKPAKGYLWISDSNQNAEKSTIGQFRGDTRAYIQCSFLYVCCMVVNSRFLETNF